MPAAWVTADWVVPREDAFRDGGEELLGRLEARGQPYVVAAERSGELSAVLQDMLQRAPAEDRWRAEAGAGGGGGRPCLWARAPLPRKAVGGKAWWLLVRRSATEGPGKYLLYLAYGPESTTLAGLVRVARTGEAVEEDLERARGEVGLGRYEVRRWEAWHRHATLCLLAHAALKVTRTREG